MFLKLYTFILIISITVAVDADYESLGSLKRSERNLKRTQNKRQKNSLEQEPFFDDIRESRDLPSEKILTVTTNKDDTMREIRAILQTLLNKLVFETNTQSHRSLDNTQVLQLKETTMSLFDLKKRKQTEHLIWHPRWGDWTSWSPCSVSCGKGREIRWRHCVEQCDKAETEMEEKACQLPACGPGKIFGIQL